MRVEVVEREIGWLDGSYSDFPSHPFDIPGVLSFLSTHTNQVKPVLIIESIHGPSSYQYIILGGIDRLPYFPSLNNKNNIESHINQYFIYTSCILPSYTSPALQLPRLHKNKIILLHPYTPISHQSLTNPNQNPPTIHPQNTNPSPTPNPTQTNQAPQPTTSLHPHHHPIPIQTQPPHIQHPQRNDRHQKPFQIKSTSIENISNPFTNDPINKKVSQVDYSGVVYAYKSHLSSEIFQDSAEV